MQVQVSFSKVLKLPTVKVLMSDKEVHVHLNEQTVKFQLDPFIVYTILNTLQ